MLSRLFNSFLNMFRRRLVGQPSTSHQTAPEARLEDFSDEQVISYVLKSKTLISALVRSDKVRTTALQDGIKPLLDAIPYAVANKVTHWRRINVSATESCGSTVDCHLSDNYYVPVSEESFIQFMDYMKLHELEWYEDSDDPLLLSNQLGDCDDFMFAACGLANIRCGNLAFGIASNGSHAFNVAYTTKGKLRYYEPQTNTFTDVTKELGVKRIWM